MMRCLLRTLFLTFFLQAAIPADAVPIDPYALSDAILIDFTFTLPADVTIQYFGGDDIVCETLGDAGCILKDEQVNFGRSSKPDGYEYSIRHEYAVEASAPPPNFSGALFELSSFFNFTSSNDDDVFLPIHWNVTYKLFTEGDFSAASISVNYATKGPDHQGLSDTPLFAPDSVSNGETSSKELNGVLDLQLFPGVTELRIEDPLTAEAAVPEPGTLALLGIGIAGFGLRRYRKASK